MKNFRTYNLSVHFYRKAKTLPLPSHLNQQFQRAASSIVLNLAEGYGRQAKADQKRFYEIALGSLRESYAILQLASDNKEILQLASNLGAHLYRLIQSKRG